MANTVSSNYSQNSNKFTNVLGVQSEPLKALTTDTHYLVVLVSIVCGLFVIVITMFVCLYAGRYSVLLTFKRRKRLPSPKKESIEFVVPEIKVTQVYVTSPVGVNTLKYSTCSPLKTPPTRSRSPSLSSTSLDSCLSDPPVGAVPLCEDDRLMDKTKLPLRRTLSRSHDDLQDHPDARSSSPPMTFGEETCRRYTMERFDIKPNELNTEQYTQSEITLDSCSPYSSCEHGKIFFGVAYNRQTEVLTVVVRKVVNLSPRPNRVFADPYVKVTLLPEKDIKYVTNVHQRTLDPVFCQTFLFPVKEDEFESKSLKLTVCDHLKFFRRNVLGYTMFPLRELGAMPLYMVHREIWRPLVEDLPFQSTSSSQGRVLLGVKLDHGQHQFTLSVLRVKDILMSDDEKTHGGILVKTTILMGQDVIKAKTTRAKKYKQHQWPVFNRDVAVRVPRDCVNRLNVTVSVFIKHTFSPSRLVGRTTLGPYSYASGSGLKHWINMLACPSQSNIMWHTLT